MCIYTQIPLHMQAREIPGPDDANRVKIFANYQKKLARVSLFLWYIYIYILFQLPEKARTNLPLSVVYLGLCLYLSLQISRMTFLSASLYLSIYCLSIFYRYAICLYIFCLFLYRSAVSEALHVLSPSRSIGSFIHSFIHSCMHACMHAFIHRFLL
jgi:hypothetical protein